MPELLKYPRDDLNATSDNDENSEDNKGEEEEDNTEYPVLINRVGGDNDDEKEENKVDRTLTEAIKTSMK